MDTPTKTASTDDLTISEVLAALPPGCDWRIVNSFEARIELDDGQKGIVYWDTLGDTDGWSYQLTGGECGEAMSGPLDTLADVANTFA